MSPQELRKKLQRTRKFHVVNVTNGVSMMPDLKCGSHNLHRAEGMKDKREREGYTVRLETFLR